MASSIAPVATVPEVFRAAVVVARDRAREVRDVLAVVASVAVKVLALVFLLAVRAALAFPANVSLGQHHHWWWWRRDLCDRIPTWLQVLLREEYAGLAILAVRALPAVGEAGADRVALRRTLVGAVAPCGHARDERAERG